MKSIAGLAASLLLSLTVVSRTVAFAPSILPLQQQQLQSATSSVLLVAAAPDGDDEAANSSSNSNSKKKGFGEAPAKKEKTDAAAKRDQFSSKYDEISAAGGQEYRVFVRQFGSDDQSWLPCGAIAVPRGAQVSDAIYANVSGLVAAIARTYPRLKGNEEEFEYGYNLKVYIDDPIEVATKNGPRPTGLSIGNWISTLLSPVDASAVPPPKIKD